MAKKISAGIALDGEKEFRQAVSGINTDMKVLQSELKKVSAEFADNKDSIEALSAKDEVLNKQLETQKDKVEALRKALENSKEQYGENDTRTDKWKISLNNAEAELSNLTREVESNRDAMEKAKNPTDDLADEIKSVGKNAEDSGKKSLKMGDIIKANIISDAIIGGVKALASAFTSIVGGIGDAVTETIDYGSAISDTAQKTGIGTTALQEYQYAASQCGMEAETLEKAMIKSQTSFANAKDGSKSLQEAYEKLGVNINDISNSEEAFDATIKALAEMGDTAEANAIASDLFGKSYAELKPLLAEGATGIDELKNKAQELGVVMSESAVSNAEALGDTLDTVKQQAAGVANTFVSMLLPGISELATGASEYMSSFSQKIQAANGDMSLIGDAIGSTLSDMVADIMDRLPEFIEGAKSIVTSLAGGIKDNIPTIIETGMSIITDLAKSLIESLPEIIATGLEIIVSLATGIADSLPELIPTIVDTIITIVETLIDNVDKLIDAALEIILALADGLIEALPKLIEKAPVIIAKLITAIVENLPKIIETGIKLIVNLGSGLIKAIPELIKNIPQIITALVNGLKEGLSDMADIGLNLVKGIWNGISNATGWIIEKIKGFGGSVLSGIKEFFGIHSPSTVFEDEVGKNLALGLGNGFTDEMRRVSADMNSSIPTDFAVSGVYNLKTNAASENSVLLTSIGTMITKAVGSISGDVILRIGNEDIAKANKLGLMSLNRRYNVIIE